MIELRWLIVPEGGDETVQMYVPGLHFKQSLRLQFRTSETYTHSWGGFADPETEITEAWGEWQNVPIASLLAIETKQT